MLKNQKSPILQKGRKRPIGPRLAHPLTTRRLPRTAQHW